MITVAIAYLAHIGVALQEPKLPMIRFTGKEGSYRNFDVLRQELTRVPRVIPYEPVMLPDGSVAVTDGKTVFAFFDPTYKPIRFLICKTQIIDLFIRNGANATYVFKNLPNPLHAELDEILHAHHSDHFRPDDFLVSFRSRLTTRLHTLDGKSSIDYNQSPQPAATPEEEKSLAELPKHSLLPASRVLRNSPGAYQFQPDVKVFVEDVAQYEKLYPAEKVMLEQFDHWLLKEHTNLDNKLFHYLEIAKALDASSDIFRCKTFSDLAQSSPTGHDHVTKQLLKEFSARGFANEDAMRSAINSSSLSNSTSILISYFLPKNKKMELIFPFEVKP